MQADQSEEEAGAGGIGEGGPKGIGGMEDVMKTSFSYDDVLWWFRFLFIYIDKKSKIHNFQEMLFK